MGEELDWEAISKEIGFSLDAITFVYEAMDYAPQYNGHEPGDVADPSEHTNALGYCKAFRQYAYDCFGLNYVAQLRSWKLATSEDLGKLVWTLVGRGLIESSLCDSPEDFQGQFDFGSDK